MCGKGSHQLLEVVLHRVGINHHTYGYQCVKGKVKDLVAEEWNDPSCMLLCGKEQTEQRMVIYPVKMSISTLLCIVCLFTL